MSAVDWLLLRDCDAIIHQMERGFAGELEASDIKLLRELLNQAKASQEARDPDATTSTETRREVAA